MMMLWKSRMKLDLVLMENMSESCETMRDFCELHHDC